MRKFPTIDGVMDWTSKEACPFLQQFEEHFRKKKRGCWVWNDDRSKRARFSVRIEGWVHQESAARTAWRFYRGPIPSGLLVCHTCDQDYCVNPEHLFLGTYADNTQDCIAKGRFVGNAKLRVDDILNIRRRCEDGESHSSIARDYPVGRMAIGKICRGKRWSHVKDSA